MQDIEVIRFAGRGIYEMRHELFDLRVAMPTAPVYLELVNVKSTDKEEKRHNLIKMVRNSGRLEGALASWGYEITFVNQWQFEFGLGGIKNYGDRKRAAQVKAQELFPNLKITQDIADAILITIYGWRKLNGVLTHGKKENFVARTGTGIVYTRERTVR